MTPLASSLVDWSALGQVALISACAGLGIGLALVLTVLSVLIVLAAIAVGLYFIAAE